MVNNGFRVFVESAKRRVGYLENWVETARRVKRVVERFYPGARVLVFGSVVRGRFNAMSDLDVLVIRDDGGRERDGLVRAAVLEELPLCPVELHFATREEFERWYRRFVEDGGFVEVI